MQSQDLPEAQQPPKRSRLAKTFRFFLPLGLIVGSVIVVVVLAGIASSKRPEQRNEGTSAILVEALQAEVSSLNFNVRSQGSVRPRTETVLVAEVSGKVVSVSDKFIAGGFFDEGEVLLEIDPSDYQTAVKRAEANLASRRARLKDEKARSEQALKDWQNLGRSGEPSELVLRLPQLADAEANVLAAQADLQKAQRDLQRTQITVPYDGLVRAKTVDVGQYVAPGTPLGTTYSVDTAEVRLPLSADDVAYLNLPSATGSEDQPLSPVRLMSDDPRYPTAWDAQIIRTEGVVDEQSRVVYAVASLRDPYGVMGDSDQPELKFGTFVRAEIQGRRAEDVVVMPRSVLRPDNTVVVTTESRELEVRPVTVLRAEPNTVYIAGGVDEGEWVITTAMDAAIPGTAVAINGIDDPSANDEEEDGAPVEVDDGEVVASTETD